MYYAIIIISVLLFGGNFYCNDIYRQMRGSSMLISMEYSLIGAVAGLITLVIINGMMIEYTTFSLIMALVSTINGFVFTFCTFKALKTINLSLYSLFSMLGGMLLPFIQGILFFGEEFTVAKFISMGVIALALILTVEKGKRKNGKIYYIGIFVLNGMSGVISKIFVSAPFEKVSSAGYSILTAICSLVLSLVFFLILTKKDGNVEKITPASITVGALSGVTNRIANFLLIIALAHVDASVQYPMATGGVIIVSTLISLFGERKPSKKEVLSVVVAFLGLLLLFAIPE